MQMEFVRENLMRLITLTAIFVIAFCLSVSAATITITLDGRFDTPGSVASDVKEA